MKQQFLALEQWPQATCPGHLSAHTAGSKQKTVSGQPHYLTDCPFVSAANRAELVQVLQDVCLGCLRTKPRGNNPPHKCPEIMKKTTSFCATCRTHVKICSSPNVHTAVSLPESFAGAAVGLAGTEYSLNASTWLYKPIFDMGANKGCLGQTTLLTSWVTLRNGDDSIKIQWVWDSGTESGFFHQGLLPFALQQRKQSFKIETFSTTTTAPETVHGVEAAFEV